jgi:N-methylhydantoinase A
MIFGGAGAIHGPLLADEIGIGRVVIPRLSAVFCGFGGLVSDLLYDVVRNVHGVALDDSALATIFGNLRAEGATWLAEQAAAATPVFEPFADVRYAGQSFDVSTRLGEAPDLAAVAEAFHAEHRRLFGHANPGAAIEIIALRLRVRGVLARPAAVPASPGGGAPAARHRRLRCNGAWHDAQLYAWADLPIGWEAQGPAVIEQETATVVVPPAFGVRVGAFGDLILQRER